jgi:DNA-binding NarL/FixJ family response regulator
MSAVVKFEPAQVIAFLEDLKIGTRDDVKLRIRAGVVTAHVKRPNGRVQSVTTMLGGRFRRLTAFDPSELSPADRRKVVKHLNKEGLRQTAIADLLGVSQATVSLDLRK